MGHKFGPQGQTVDPSGAHQQVVHSTREANRCMHRILSCSAVRPFALAANRVFEEKRHVSRSKAEDQR